MLQAILGQNSLVNGHFRPFLTTFRHFWSFLENEFPEGIGPVTPVFGVFSNLGLPEIDFPKVVQIWPSFQFLVILYVISRQNRYQKSVMAIFNS